MTEVLLAAGFWLGVSLLAVLMFTVGFTLGRRNGWEEGCRRGWQAARAGEPDPPRLARRRAHARDRGLAEDR